MPGIPFTRERAVDAKRPEQFLTPTEASFIIEKRGLGFSDQAIAAMLNRPVTSLDLHVVVDVAEGDRRQARRTRQPRRSQHARVPAVVGRSEPTQLPSEQVGGSNTQGMLRSFIERLEQMQAAKDAISADMKALFSEAKGAGFTPATMRRVVAFRKRDQAKADQQQAEFETYLNAVQGDLFGDKAA